MKVLHLGPGDTERTKEGVTERKVGRWVDSCKEAGLAFAAGVRPLVAAPEPYTILLLFFLCEQGTVGSA